MSADAAISIFLLILFALYAGYLVVYRVIDASRKQVQAPIRSMIGPEALQEVEEHVKKLNTQPLSLELLIQAIDMIAAVTGGKITKSLDNSLSGARLQIHTSRKHMGSRTYNIKYSRGDFFEYYVSGPDMTLTQASLEQLAWLINGHVFLPRHVRAAKARCQKEGKDETRIPWPYIMEEAQKDPRASPTSSSSGQ